MVAEWRVNTGPREVLSRTMSDFSESAVSNDAWRRYLRACIYKTMRECRKVNKSLTAGLVLGAIAASTVGAVAGYRMVTTPSGAPVISAKALVKTVKTPRQECHDEQVTHTKPVKDENRLAGTGIGAVVGGLLGSRIGGGNTRIATGLAGAAAGGYAGNKIQQKMQQGNTYTTTEQRCVTAYDSHEETTGYEVVYELDGKRHHVHMDHDPGREIPVRDGQIVVDTAKPEPQS